jgi:hypothetical protein
VVCSVKDIGVEFRSAGAGPRASPSEVSLDAAFALARAYHRPAVSAVDTWSSIANAASTAAPPLWASPLALTAVGPRKLPAARLVAATSICADFTPVPLGFASRQRLADSSASPHLDVKALQPSRRRAGRVMFPKTGRQRPAIDTLRSLFPAQGQTVAPDEDRWGAPTLIDADLGVLTIARAIRTPLGRSR